MGNIGFILWLTTHSLDSDVTSSKNDNLEFWSDSEEKEKEKDYGVEDKEGGKE